MDEVLYGSHQHPAISPRKKDEDAKEDTRGATRQRRSLESASVARTTYPKEPHAHKRKAPSPMNRHKEEPSPREDEPTIEAAEESPVEAAAEPSPRETQLAADILWLNNQPDSLREEIRQFVNRRYEELAKANIELQAIREYCEQEITSLATQLAMQREITQASERENALLRKTIESQDDRLEKLAKELNALRSRYKGLMDENVNLHVEIESRRPLFLPRFVKAPKTEAFIRRISKQ